MHIALALEYPLGDQGGTVVVAPESLRERLGLRAPASLRDRQMTAPDIVARSDALYRSLVEPKS